MLCFEVENKCEFVVTDNGHRFRGRTKAKKRKEIDAIQIDGGNEARYTGFESYQEILRTGAGGRSTTMQNV
jgi:hypothetical protein